MLKKCTKIFELSLLAALCASLCIGTWAGARHSSISGSLVRLHVVAVSDDGYEQALKLRVRDSVLNYLRPKLSAVDSRAESEAVISAELDGIAHAAAEAAEGRQVTVSLGREFYPTKNYGNFALPAGEYDSLRVILGEGKGQNWWCVVFPPLCTDTVSCGKMQSVMSDEDYAVITESDGYELRFRVLEIWGEISEFFDNI